MDKFMPPYTYYQIVFQKDYNNFCCFLWPILFSKRAFQNTKSNTSIIVLFFLQSNPRKALFMLTILLWLLTILKCLWNYLQTCFSGLDIEFSLSLVPYILFIAECCSYSVHTGFLLMHGLLVLLSMS